MNMLLIDLLDKEKVEFDAVYMRLRAPKSCEQFCNYNQIYHDFDQMAGRCLGDDRLEEHVLVLAPLCLDNDDIREKEGEDLLI